MPPEPARKPLGPMESRDERLTVRLTSTERRDWQDAARRAGEEESRFFRRCALIGRKVREARVLDEATGA
jgi:hypothetical protein